MDKKKFKKWSKKFANVRNMVAGTANAKENFPKTTITRPKLNIFNSSNNKNSKFNLLKNFFKIFYIILILSVKFIAADEGKFVFVFGRI